VTAVDDHLLKRIWGEATALLDLSRKIRWLDLLLLLGMAGFTYGIFNLALSAAAPHEEGALGKVTIHLEPWYLPQYTFFSLTRGILAYFVSLSFTLVYGYWAAKDSLAQKVLIPLLDILQSIPVLGFMPGLVYSLAILFPTNNFGLEVASVLMIFTGQAWNMTFSFFQSVRSVPLDMREVATVYRMSWWQRFRWVELPFSGMGLVWNSMMSMAGGWFFLSACEALQLGEKDLRLAGIGSYMKQAVDDFDVPAMIYAIIAMTLMIVALDQLVWRPIIVWAQKFRVEEGGAQEAMHSWFLDLLLRSRLVRSAGHLWQRFTNYLSRPARPGAGDVVSEGRPAPRWVGYLALIPFALLIALLAYGAWELFWLITKVQGSDWLALLGASLLTLGRVLLATILGTLWTVPAGLRIGLSPRLSRILQPVVQIVASFPAPMLFPVVILVLEFAGVSLDWGSILLMLLGTQWYILFNVIAGAMAIPADLKEAARSYNITGWQRFWVLYLPAIFPYLVTGWITAAGGAWNASIVSEYISMQRNVLEAHGLGARISEAAGGSAFSFGAACGTPASVEPVAAVSANASLSLLVASVLIMSTLVVLFNRLVWRRLYHLADTRFSVNR
jgi:NitT/TauT family transport system permease protein